MKKLISLFLCIALLLSMAGCKRKTQDPTPTESLAKSTYTQARDTLNGQSNVTLALTITTLTTVDGDTFSERSAQTLTYQEKGAETAIIMMEETPEFNVHTDESDTDSENSDPFQYKEIWHQGTVYVEAEDVYRYKGSVTATDAAQRYLPVVLLNPDLYSNITSETAQDGTLIRFATPSAGESWAMPQDSTFVEASGSALVNASGILTEMNYTITYTYGPARVTKTVQSKPLDTPKTITAPADPNAYTALGYIDALRTYVSAIGNLMQANRATVINSESLLSEAAAATKNQNVQADIYVQKADTVAKLDTSISFMNYSTMQSEEYHQVESYADSKLTTVINDGLPSTSNISWKNLWDYVSELMISGMPDMDYWKDVSITHMSSVSLLEFQFNDSFGNTLQNSICQSLWNDPAFLMNLASNYTNMELTGYLSIDRYTGLPVASGYYYKGIHTIKEHPYTMTMQFDQSIEIPAKGAYQEITGQMPQEAEPTTKATPLFYRVTGKNGQEMWLFGTIHVGDERTAFLPDEIFNAFTASDALALECNTELFEQRLEQDDKLAEQVSGLYFYTDGSEVVKASLNEEDFAYAQKLLKAVGANNTNMPYAKPYIWSNAIELFYLRQGYQLHSDQGVEARLVDWAAAQSKEILEIESSLSQLQMFTGFSKELQMLMLEEAITFDAQEYWEQTKALYELWCSGNKEALEKEITDDWANADLSDADLVQYKSLLDEYDKAMNFDRNETMLKAAVQYLESGKVVFYAVGLAHLLDTTNGLVNALQNAGYTVEQVSFTS